jgi:hypothetical protein
MVLPGASGQLWNVNISLDNHLTELVAGRVSCSLTLDGVSKKVVAAKAQEDQNVAFPSIESGNYSVFLACPNPGEAFPHPAAQVIQLWAGAAGADTRSEEISIRVDAKKN